MPMLWCLQMSVEGRPANLLPLLGWSLNGLATMEQSSSDVIANVISMTHIPDRVQMSMYPEDERVIAFCDAECKKGVTKKQYDDGIEDLLRNGCAEIMPAEMNEHPVKKLCVH